MALKLGFGSTFSSLDFDEDFQQQILVMLAKDLNFVVYYGSRLIKPYFFDLDTHADIAQQILDYYNNDGKLAKLPGRATVTLMLKDYVREIPSKASRMDDYMEMLSEIYQFPMEAVDAGYVKGKVLEFCKLQACKIAAQQALQCLEYRQFNKVPKLFQDAVLVGEEIHDLPKDHFEGFVDRMESYMSGEDDYGRVPTGIKGIDAILHGGPGPGDLAVFMGRVNGGKSSLLINVGAAALRYGYNVLHVSLEMSKRAVEKKYDAALTGIPTQDFKDNILLLKDKMFTDVMELTGASLRIQKKPEGRYDVDELRKDLRLLALEEGFKPDVILVDYLDRMRNCGKALIDRKERIAATWQEFRALLGDLGIPGWTVSQKRRGARGEGAWNSEEDDDGDETSDAIDKFVIADIWISTGQSKDEYRAKTMRLYVAKCRENVKNQVIYVSTDFSTCTFKDISEDYIEDDDE